MASVLSESFFSSAVQATQSLPLPPVWTIMQQDAVLNSFTQSLCILTTGYLFLCHFTSASESPRRRSWLLTFLSSFIMTLGSIPCVLSFVYGSSFDLSQHPTINPATDIFLCSFFMAYLFLDLLIGTLTVVLVSC
jgi:hypothetical protein